MVLTLHVFTFQPRDPYNLKPGDRFETLICVGFQFFNILLRMIDLSEDNHIRKSRKYIYIKKSIYLFHNITFKIIGMC